MFWECTTSQVRENWVLQLLLGGAAVYRCDKRHVLNAASAAEVMHSAQKRLFPQPLQLCRQQPNAGLFQAVQDYGDSRTAFEGVG
jgi:hypothetical protein